MQAARENNGWEVRAELEQSQSASPLTEFDQDPIDLGKITLSLEPIDEFEREPEPVSATPEELRQVIEINNDLIADIQKRIAGRERVTKRLSAYSKEIEESLEQAAAKVTLTASEIGAMAMFSACGGALLGVVSTIGNLAITGGAVNPLLVGGIGAGIGFIITIPSIALGFWTCDVKPWRKDYWEFKKIVKDIERVAKEERLTDQYRLKLYQEATQKQLDDQQALQKEISAIENSNQRTSLRINELIANEQGRLSDRFENAKIKLGLKQGEIRPTPKELREEEAKLWREKPQ